MDHSGLIDDFGRGVLMLGKPFVVSGQKEAPLLFVQKLFACLWSTGGLPLLQASPGPAWVEGGGAPLQAALAELLRNFKCGA